MLLVTHLQTSLHQRAMVETEQAILRHSFEMPNKLILLHAACRVPKSLLCDVLHCLGRLQGLRKPAPAAYQAAVSHLQLPPERFIFVDDRQPNVDAAAAVGMQAIRFEGNPNALEDQLQKLGLEF